MWADERTKQPLVALAQPPDENPLIQIQESNHHRHDHATIYTNNFPVPFPIPISLPEPEFEVVKKNQKKNIDYVTRYLCLNSFSLSAPRDASVSDEAFHRTY